MVAFFTNHEREKGKLLIVNQVTLLSITKIITLIIMRIVDYLWLLLIYNGLIGLINCRCVYKSVLVHKY